MAESKTEVVAAPAIIPLPEDTESKISVLLWVSALVMQAKVTELAYDIEVFKQQINGLSRTPRDVEKANKAHLAMHIRLYGPISQLGGQDRKLGNQKWLIMGAFALISVVVFGYYWSAYPDARLGLQVWWQQNGGYIEAFILLLVFVMVAYLYVRTRRKPVQV